VRVRVFTSKIVYAVDGKVVRIIIISADGESAWGTVSSRLKQYV
jgi:hypothetical protein